MQKEMERERKRKGRREAEHVLDFSNRFHYCHRYYEAANDVNCGLQLPKIKDTYILYLGITAELIMRNCAA